MKTSLRIVVAAALVTAIMTRAMALRFLFSAGPASGTSAGGTPPWPEFGVGPDHGYRPAGYLRWWLPFWRRYSVQQASAGFVTSCGSASMPAKGPLSAKMPESRSNEQAYPAPCPRRGLRPAQGCRHGRRPAWPAPHWMRRQSERETCERCRSEPCRPAPPCAVRWRRAPDARGDFLGQRAGEGRQPPDPEPGIEVEDHPIGLAQGPRHGRREMRSDAALIRHMGKGGHCGHGRHHRR